MTIKISDLESFIYSNVNSGKKGSYFMFCNQGMKLKIKKMDYNIHEFNIFIENLDNKEFNFKWSSESKEEYKEPLLFIFDKYGEKQGDCVRFALYYGDKLISTSDDTKRAYVYFLLSNNNGKEAYSVSFVISLIDNKKISALISDSCPEINHFTKCVAGLNS